MIANLETVGADPSPLNSSGPGSLAPLGALQSALLDLLRHPLVDVVRLTIADPLFVHRLSVQRMLGTPI
jgi:hypothetical protein